MKILILGAGLVARPVVDYFLTKKYMITLADIELEKAQLKINNRPNGRAIQLDASNDEKKLSSLIKDHDIVVLLLPPKLTTLVAKYCIQHKKNLIGTNYVDEELKKLHKKAIDAGITIICEAGVDPGIDHMIAQKIIDETHAQGGKVQSFKSYCGGLPAPAFNTNPLGYKFSWSPRGVLLASKRPATYLENNQIVTIPGENIFQNEFIGKLYINEDIGALEVYPNSNSILYKKEYNIPEAETIYRSTLRYPGWSETILALQRLQYLNLEEKSVRCSYAEFLADLIHSENKDIIQESVNYLGVSSESAVISRLKWLGLFSKDRINEKRTQLSPLDLLTSIMISKMTFDEQEKDLLVLINEFIIETINKQKERINISFIEYGKSKEYSAMAKTVSFAVVVCTELLLEGSIKQKGIVIPTTKEIYEPVLDKLHDFGFELKITKSLL